MKLALLTISKTAAEYLQFLRLAPAKAQGARRYTTPTAYVNEIRRRR